MTKHILFLAIAALLLSAQCTEDKAQLNDSHYNNDCTILTFLIEYEPEPDNDHINIGLTVSAKDTSLKSAIQKVTRIVDSIKDLATNFCNDNPDDDATIDCDKVVDVDDFEINAEYIRRRKEEQIFQDFVVSHQVKVRADNTDKIGELGDKLLKLENTKIEEFEWGTNEENDDEEEAIEMGKKKAEDMCFHLGMKLNRIISVEAVEDDEEEKKTDDEDEEEEQEDETLVYKFEVECKEDQEALAKKAAEEEEEDRLKDAEEAREKEREEKEQKEKQNESEKEEEEQEQEQEEEQEKPKKKKGKSKEGKKQKKK